MDYAFSPDSKEVCYVKNTAAMVAISTNNDLFTVSVGGGASKGLLLILQTITSLCTLPTVVI